MSFQLAKLNNVAHDTGFAFLQRAIHRADPLRQRARLHTEDPNMQQQLAALKQQIEQLTKTTHVDKRGVAVGKAIGLHRPQNQMTLSQTSDVDDRTDEIGKALTQGVFSLADKALMRIIKDGDNYSVHIDTMEFLKLLVLVYAGVKIMDYALQKI